ncbi:MAG: glycoside hydrolase family 3 C-terminal domain-containing protein [Bacilli bacterium]|nr:glycoside hydrolase family 3 C-terminal domain-containing protein [Bacilli bacterium]
MKYKEIIEKMTLNEKVSLLSGKDNWQTMNIDKYNIPSMFLTDGPSGIRKQTKDPNKVGLNIGAPSTCFPAPSTLANSWDKKLCEEVGKMIGDEACCEKVNVVLGPGANIKRNPLCGRNFEYFSEDPYLTGKLAANYIKGIQSNGIAACVKHFACNNQETRREAIDTILDERTFREIYLTGFEICVEEGDVKAIMSSYNKVNGYYTNENVHLMSGILRSDWKYKGTIISEWGGSDSRVRGLLAGNDLEMPTTCGESNEEIVEAIKQKVIKESVVDNAVSHLIDLAYSTNEAVQSKSNAFNIEEHNLFAQQAAERSIVLLKNENAVLPLNNQKKIAIIGDFARHPRYQGAGSSIVNPTKLDNILSVIDEYDINYIGYARGYSRFGKKSQKEINAAVRLAQRADLVLLFIGLDDLSETEGVDRNDMKLPSNQLDLLEKLKDVECEKVAILSCGSPIEMDFADQMDGVLHTYLSGQAGSRAIMNILVNNINPSGKLAESYPYRLSDCSSTANFAQDTYSVEYREGLFVGYRYYDTANVKVRYPFGFGLSYTNFEYSNLKVTDKGVSFYIKNIGDYDGEEIAELYVGMKKSAIFRPTKELKGFQKVFIKKQQKVNVRIPFDDKTFRYFDINYNTWRVESGIYEVMIGASSQDIRLQATIEKVGDGESNPYNKNHLPSYFSGKVKDVKLKEFESLLRKKVPNQKDLFYRKNRIVVDRNTSIDQLIYAKGWVGRFFIRSINVLLKYYKLTKNRKRENEIIFGFIHKPIRTISRMSNGLISWGQLEGLIMAFNGKLFRGIFKYIFEGHKKKSTVKVYKKKYQQE